MWLTSDTTTALVLARNDKQDLKSVKKNDPKPAADSGGISGTLEALAAVIPTGVATIYMGAVLVVRGAALSDGTDKRAAAEPRSTGELFADA